MQSSKVAKRYAQGLYEFSTEQNLSESVYTEMKDVVKIMENSRDLTSFFAIPFVDIKKKLNAAEQIFAGFSHPVRNFVSLVIKQGRGTDLKAIAQQFIKKIDAEKGIQQITLTTADRLSEEKMREILQSISIFDASKQYEVQANINPNLIGGYIVRIGDQQVDASVRTKLDNLKKQFQLN